MKAVLLSIQPKWCELIANGKKTIEVRKTKPKLKTPFKVYIYCTQGREQKELLKKLYKHLPLNNKVVIGEFICNEITVAERGSYCDIPTKKSQMDVLDYLEYADEKTVCGWHISDLVIYDKPKELGEFKTPPCERPESACGNCKYLEVTNTPNTYEVECYRENGVHLTRPPQSWCYVSQIEKEGSK